MKPIVMVMPYRQYVRKARAEGFAVHAIWDRTRIPADHVAEIRERSEELIYADFADIPSLRRLVAETAVRTGAAHVLHLGREDTQLPVCEEATALGLAPNPPGALRVLNDKAAMRCMLAEHGLSPVRVIEVGCADDAVRRIPRFGLPAVLKPTGLSGSRGVRLIRETSDLDEWSRSVIDHGYTGPVLIEEYLRGPEFSVETLTAEGHHHVVGLTAKRKTPPPVFAELGHLHPAVLSEAKRDTVAGLVVTFLDAAGYRFGPAHTEVIITPRGPRIVESQSRIGGDRIPRAIELATGFDIEAAVFRALGGGGSAIAEPAIARRVGCVSFFRFRPGTLTTVSGLDEVRSLPFVHELRFPFAPGDTFPEIRDSTGRHGHVVIDAPSQRAADARIAQVNSMITVRTA